MRNGVAACPEAPVFGPSAARPKSGQDWFCPADAAGSDGKSAVYRKAKEEVKASLPRLVTLGGNLHAWREETAVMWRFTRNNAAAEGFGGKTELVNRKPKASATSKASGLG